MGGNHWSTGIFYTQPSLGFTENGLKKRNIQWVKMPCWCRRSERNDQTGSADRKATVTQISARYNQGLQKSFSEHSTCQSLKQKSSSSKRHTPVSLLSDNNSKLRLQFTRTHQNWTIEDWRNADFCCNIQMVGPEFGVKSEKYGSILP